MAKYLDLTGLSHYDQKIKQYIAQHGGGGSVVYKHNLYVEVNTSNATYYVRFEIINGSSTPITNSNIIVNKDYLCIVDDGDDTGGVYSGVIRRNSSSKYFLQFYNALNNAFVSVEGTTGDELEDTVETL